MIRVTNKEKEMLGCTAHMEKTGDGFKILIGGPEWKKMGRSRRWSEALLMIFRETACEGVV